MGTCDQSSRHYESGLSNIAKTVGLWLGYAMRVENSANSIVQVSHLSYSIKKVSKLFKTEIEFVCGKAKGGGGGG